MPKAKSKKTVKQKQPRLRDKPVQAWLTGTERKRIARAAAVAKEGGMKMATFLRWAGLEAAKQILARK